MTFKAIERFGGSGPTASTAVCILPGLAGVSRHLASGHNALGMGRGSSESVTTLLSGGVLKKDMNDGLTVLHLSADCSFHETEKKTGNTHLEFEGARLLDLYLYTLELQNTQIQDSLGKKTETKVRRWMIEAIVDVKRQAQGVTGAEYVALLDRQRRVVICGRKIGFSANFLVAPKDWLLSASTLRMVVYEWGAAEAKKDKQGQHSQ